MADGTKPRGQSDPKTTPMKISKNDNVTNSSSDNEMDDEMRCDICDKPFSGVKPFEQHIKGRKHAKAAKRLRMKTKLDVETAENKNADTDNLPSYEPYETCEPCCKEFGGPESYQQHVDSKGHKRKIVEHAVLEQVKEAGNVNMDRLKEMYKLKSGKHVEKSDAGAYYNVTSDELTEQVPGSTHDKSFDDLSEDTYECKPCGNVLTGLAPFIQHLKSKRHSKVEKEMEFYEMLKANSPGKTEISPTSEIEKLMSCLQMVGGIITCNLCKTSVSGYESAVSHVKGKKHSGKLETKEWKMEHRKKDSLGERKNEEMQQLSDLKSAVGDSGENAESSTDHKLSENDLVGKETSI